MRKTIFILILYSLILGCNNNKLDRSKAEKIITDFYGYPNVEFIKLKKLAWLNDINTTLKGLRSQDLISHQKTYYVGSSYHIYPTEKGRDYFFKENTNNYLMASNIREFQEVTGIKISEGEKYATVNFTVKRKDITAFGKYKGYFEGAILKYQVKLSLYDDGWRITNKKSKNHTKEDFKCFE